MIAPIDCLPQLSSVHFLHGLTYLIIDFVVIDTIIFKFGCCDAVKNTFRKVFGGSTSSSFLPCSSSQLTQLIHWLEDTADTVFSGIQKGRYILSQ
jgi:hypothetical protein